MAHGQRRARGLSRLGPGVGGCFLTTASSTQARLLLANSGLREEKFTTMLVGLDTELWKKRDPGYPRRKQTFHLYTYSVDFGGSRYLSATVHGHVLREGRGHTMGHNMVEFTSQDTSRWRSCVSPGVLRQ